ncbi:MAG: oligosaccharide repeat unit polymerase [Paludibacteraceae bacterium]|nr:oligosaccharide repeat unit polymerase [Paludibacteraceae bacterium]
MKDRVIFLLFVAIIASVYYCQLPVCAFNSSLFDIGMLMIIISMVVFVRYSESSPLKGFWIRPSFLFIIGYLAVNFQYLLDFRLGLKTVSSRMILYPDILNHCMVLGVVGLLSFVAGYINIPVEENSLHSTHSSVKQVELPTSILVVLNFFLFVAFIATIDIVPFLSGVSYSSSEQGNAQIEGLLYVSNALIVVQACIQVPDNCTVKKYVSVFPKLSLCIVSLYMLMRLLSGDRGPFIYTALLLFFGYAYSSRRRVKLRSVIFLAIGGMLFISLVGIARSLDKGVGFGDRMSEAFEMFNSGGRFSDREERSVFSLTEELGFSFFVNQTDVHAVEVNGEPFNYGLYTFNEVLSAIPFMPSLLQTTLSLPPERFSSAGFANFHYFGGYERNWGIGTSIVGDFFLQFGVWGVLLGMFLSGVFLRYLDILIYVRDKSFIGVFTLLFIFLFASKSIYMPRAMLLVELPRFVWGSILLLLFGVKRKKQL